MSIGNVGSSSYPIGDMPKNPKTVQDMTKPFMKLPSSSISQTQRPIGKTPSTPSSLQQKISQDQGPRIRAQARMQSKTEPKQSQSASQEKPITDNKGFDDLMTFLDGKGQELNKMLQQEQSPTTKRNDSMPKTDEDFDKLMTGIDNRQKEIEEMLEQKEPPTTKPHQERHDSMPKTDEDFNKLMAGIDNRQKEIEEMLEQKEPPTTRPHQERHDSMPKTDEDFNKLMAGIDKKQKELEEMLQNPIQDFSFLENLSPKDVIKFKGTETEKNLEKELDEDLEQMRASETPPQESPEISSRQELGLSHDISPEELMSFLEDTEREMQTKKEQNELNDILQQLSASRQDSIESTETPSQSTSDISKGMNDDELMSSLKDIEREMQIKKQQSELNDILQQLSASRQNGSESTEISFQSAPTLGKGISNQELMDELNHIEEEIKQKPFGSSTQSPIKGTEQSTTTQKETSFPTASSTSRLNIFGKLSKSFKHLLDASPSFPVLFIMPLNSERIFGNKKL